MRILGHELRKLLSMPALWGFIALILIVNLFLVFSNSYRDEIRVANDVAAILGPTYTADYTERIKGLKAVNDIYSWYLEDMAAASEDAADIYDTYNTGDVYKKLTEAKDVSDRHIPASVLRLLEKKYEALKPVVAEKASTDEALSVYFGGMTTQIHEFAFGTFGRLLLCETGLIAFLSVLFSLGYENLTKAEGLVYSTRTGRRLIKRKVLACVLSFLLLFTLVFGVSYAVLFLYNGYTGVFGQSVASINNHVYYDSSSLSFLTWDSLSIGEYFLLTAAVSLLLGLVFLLIGAALAAVVKNAYTAFGVLAFLLFLNVTAILVGRLNYTYLLYYIVRLTPYGLIDMKTLWFTEGGMYGVIPYFETVFSVFYVLLFAVLFLLCARYFKTKDVL